MEQFLLDRGLDPAQEYQMTVWETGKLPFDLVYPRACKIENFWRQEDFDHLPYRFLLVYQEDTDNTRSVLWRCNLCGFWCTVFDQRLVERHLCVMCPLMSDFDRLQLKTYVLEQALRQIEDTLES